MTVDFKPSNVVLGIPPLCGTMKKAEIEFAATLYICACRHFGNKWQPLEPKLIGEAIRADLESGTEPLASLNHNPFFRPDMYAFVHSEYVHMTEEHEPIEFTEAGFEALRKWVSCCICERTQDGEVVRVKDCPVAHND